MKEPKRYCDGGGLWLQVRGAKHKSWVFRYQGEKKTSEAGKEYASVRWMGLGTFPEVSLAEAREAAAAARKLVRDGRDPIDSRRHGVRLSRQRRTFQEACDGWVAKHRAEWEDGTTRAIERSLREACAVIGSMAVADITSDDVERVLEPIWFTKNPTAVRVRGWIENALWFAITKGWRGHPNPAAWRGNMENLLAKPSAVHEVKNHPALPWENVPEFMAAVSEEEGMAPIALRFYLLTVPRTDMVLTATWQEIGLKDRLWTIPAKRMKGKKGQRAEFRLPLSTAALAVLEEVRSLQDGPESPVFPSPMKRGQFMNESVLRVLRDKMEAEGKITINGYPCGHVSVHGFRSTFTDWAEENGWPSNVTQASLAHVERNKVTRAYKRTDLLEQRRKLMEAWGEYCTSPPKVVPIQKKAEAA